MLSAEYPSGAPIKQQVLVRKSDGRRHDTVFRKCRRKSSAGIIAKMIELTASLAASDGKTHCRGPWQKASDHATELSKVLESAGTVGSRNLPGCNTVCAVHVPVAFWPIETLGGGKSPKICPHTAIFSPRKFLPSTHVAENM